jgi:hypothetical protein
MTEIIKKDLSVYFSPKDLTEFANGNFKEREKISGFNEEVLIGLFLLRWFKEGKRKDSNFSIGFKYKVEYESELGDLVKHKKLSPALFSKRFADQNTLSDLIIKSSIEQIDLDTHFQIKAFPRENNPENITDELIKLLEKKRYVDVGEEVLLIYSHFTQGLDPDTLSKYLETYPYKSVIQVFWSNGNTLNFLKLKPPTYQHYSLNYRDVFKTSEGF